METQDGRALCGTWQVTVWFFKGETAMCAAFLSRGGRGGERPIERVFSSTGKVRSIGHWRPAAHALCSLEEVPLSVPK